MSKHSYKLTRAILACLTAMIIAMIALTGCMIDDHMYMSTVGILVLIAILSSDNCRFVPPSIEAFESGIDMLVAIPQNILDTITPSLDRMASVVRGDDGSKDVITTDLSPSFYKNDPLLHHDDGLIDQPLLDTMKLEYKRIVTLLCRMKYLATESHDLLVTAMSCETATSENVK